MLGITRKGFISYSVLPGIKPRLQEIFFSGFQYLAFFIALVYQAVRLLPPGHPYTKPSNIGRFGIRHVIAEAANNLVISRRNIDQIILFAVILVGMVIGLIQIILFGFSLMAGPVMAAGFPASFSDFFITDKPKQDIAFMMLDMVFGIPDFFYSCVSTGGGCVDSTNKAIVDSSGSWILGSLSWPFPIHQGLHAMFIIYSSGLLVVAALIAIYFIAAILLETAQTGTPFGKRFNKVWAPLRIVVAFGLLIPFDLQAGGLNSSQYIVLYAAKFGSGFATNGWNLFNNTLTDSYLGKVDDLVSQPQIPEVSGFLQFMYSAATCFEGELLKEKRQIYPFLVRDTRSDPHAACIVSKASKCPADVSYHIQNYQDAINFADGDRQLLIRFGTYDKERNAKEKGYVRPVCGEIVLPLIDARDPANAADPPERSAVIMQATYFFLIRDLWFNTFDGGSAAPELSPWAGIYYTYNTIQQFTQWDHDPNAQLPPPEYKDDLQHYYSAIVEAAMKDPSSYTELTSGEPIVGSEGAIKEGIKSKRWSITPVLIEKGWAGAGIWYNKVAELNGAVSNAVMNTPIPSRYPEVMEYTKEKKNQENQNVSVSERFKPELARGVDVPAQRPEDTQLAVAYWNAFNYWQADGGATSTHTAVTGNPILDFVNQIFGTSGLYSLRKNPTVHPLAQLVGVGRSLIEASTRNIGSAALASIVGAAADKSGGKLAGVFISLCVTLVTVSLTAGSLLYYVVPFMPFIYYYFAMGTWIKAIFEAMLGAPLWALAHIRIDGEGLPGKGAMQGYFLLLEIFLRPILIVFGFLASISIFAAMVSVLNNTWELVSANLSGFDVETELNGGASLIEFMRGPVDEFFFTVIYAIVIYLLGMSSFKLVDQIPASIMRWLGQSVMVFNDGKEDAGEGLMGAASVGTQQGISGLGGGMQSAMQSITQLGKGP